MGFKEGNEDRDVISVISVISSIDLPFLQNWNDAKELNQQTGDCQAVYPAGSTRTDWDPLRLQPHQRNEREMESR